MEGSKWEDWFVYDETSPSCLVWVVERRSGNGGGRVNVRAGDFAGTLNSKGYYQVVLQRKFHLCHRIIVEMQGVLLTREDHIDHIDGNPANNKSINLRAVKEKYNHRNTKISCRNKSGVVGVWHRKEGGYECWSAVWRELDGKQGVKYFSIAKHGAAEAFRMACECREEKMKELNDAGAGYTIRHGT